MLALGALSVLVGNLGAVDRGDRAFLLAAGRAEREHQLVMDALGDLRAGDLVRDAPVCIPADLSVSEAIARFFARHLYTAFP